MTAKSTSMEALTNSIVGCGNVLVAEAARILRPHGVTVPQFNVLQLLAEAPDGLRPSALASSLVVDPSSTTYVVDRMEALSWVRRDHEAGDRRAHRVVLTEEGRKVHREAAKTYRKALAGLILRMPPFDAGHVTEVLQGIRGAAVSVADEVILERPVAETRGRGRGRVGRPART